MSNLTINNGGIITNSRDLPNLDLRYGPYDSIESATEALGDLITPGLTIGIQNNERIIEYQVNNDYEFIPKTSSAQSNYDSLENLPKINNIELKGNKTNEQLGIPTKTSDLINDSGFISEETEPSFNSSPAKDITENDIEDWNNKSDFSGSYDDLSNKPTIPSKTSDLTNDSSFISASDLSTVATTGDYDDLTNKPTIPSKTSDLVNDSEFISSESEPAFNSSVAKNITENDITNWNSKQEELESGVNIKTINNESILGNGNIIIPRGEDGAPGNNGHNPCLGRFSAVQSTFAETPRAGDYYYVDTVDNTTTPPTVTETKIYKYDGTQWEAGTVIDAEHPTLASGQAVTSVHIKDLDGDDVPSAQGVLSAEAGKEINNKIEGEFTYDSVTYDNTEFTYGYLYSRAGIFQDIPTGYSAIRKAIPADVESIEAVGLFNSQYYYGAYFLSSSSGNSFISGLPQYSGGNKNFYHKIEKSDIPANAAYIVIIAEHDAYVTWSDVYVKINTKSLVSEGIKQEIAELNNRVDNTLNDSSDLVPVKKSYTYYVGARENFEQFYFPVNKGDVIRVNSTREFPQGGILRVKNNGTVVQTKTEYVKFVNYELNIIADGDLYFYCSSTNSISSTITIEILKYATQDEKNISDYVDNLDCLPKDKKEIARYSVGLIAHSDLGERLGSCNYNSGDNAFVGYNVFEFDNILKNNKNIVVINHDDLQSNDWIATRKIYEKYGMTANFSMIVNPFVDVSEKDKKVYGIKQLLKGGNKIGLHSVLGSSWWFFNPLFDVRPDGSSTFAPTLSEIKGSNQDGTGVNTFGVEITSITTVSTLNLFINPPSNLASVKVVELTEEQYKTLVQHYTWLGNSETISTGLDLNDNPRNGWSKLKWIEYWYNCLVDSAVNYSNSGDIATKFANDYDVPSGASAIDYYPEAKQLLEGKVIYYGDTTNPHYSEALVKTDPSFDGNSYQLVGKFTKGIYKNCYSTCNYEVLPKVIRTMNEFVRYYYGMNCFDNYNMHGIGYANVHWVDSQTGLRYNEKTKTKLDSANEKLFFTYLNGFSTSGNILKGYGISNLHQLSPSNAILEGETGLWFGQKGCIKDWQALQVQNCDVIDYLCVATTNSSQPSGGLLSYSDLTTFLSGIDNRSKYFFENANTTKTRNGKTLYIPNDFRSIILAIVRSIGTGRVPIISLDTITVNANNSMGTELVLRFCRELGLRVVDIETARQLCTSFSRDYKINWFPNPTFRQSLLEYFGGNSSSSLAKTPDGFVLSNTCEVTVSDETIDNARQKVLSVSNGYAEVNVFGLTPGTYRMSLYAKSVTGSSNSVKLFIKKNSDYINRNYLQVERISPVYTAPVTSSNYVLCDYVFEIPEFEQIIDGDSPEHRLCCGYENNVGKITLRFEASSGEMKLYKPEIKVI